MSNSSQHLTQSSKSKRSRALYGTVGAAPIVAMLVSSQPAYAGLLSTASNTVNLCSGVQLPRSDVTAIVQPLTDAVAPLETTTNTLLSNTSTLLTAVKPLTGALGLNTPTQLSTNISGLMTQAAQGNITLAAVSNNGTVLGPSDACYAQASGVALTTPAGISVGGNAITGLGDSNKNVASAGELNSIAFGNNAATSATAANSIALGPDSSIGANGTNSVAIGSQAQVTVGNSVALGAGSSAARGAQSGYTAYALTAPQTSVGEVSVGTSSGQRQITNVAAGSAGTDAVNVSQLSAVGDRITTLDNLAVKYDNSSHLTITLGGNGGTTITNLRPGDVSSTSTDAINGSQLNTTNTNVTNVTNNLANTNVNVTNLTNNLATTNSNVTNLTNNITNGAIGIWRYSNAAGTPNSPAAISNDVTIIGTGGPVGVHNVANGAVNATSNDAVNGSQLYGLGQTINTQIANNVATINTTIGGIDARVTNNTNNITNIDARTTSNTNTINTLSTNVSNIDARVTTNTNNIANIDARTTQNSTDITNIGAQVATNTTNIAGNTTSINTLNTNVANIDGRVTLLTNGGAGPVQYSNGGTTPNGGIPSQDLTLVGLASGPVSLHNVAAGAVNATSTDAVNGSQLDTTNQNVSALDNSVTTINTNVTNLGAQVSTNTTNITNLGGRVDQNTSDITDLGARVTTNTTNIANNTTNIANNTTSITNLGGRVDQNTTDITDLGSRVTNNTTNITNNTTAITNLGGRVDQNTTDITDLGTRVTNNTTNIANNATNITNVDNRVTTLNTSFGDFQTSVSNGGVGPVQYSNGGTTPNGGTRTQDLTLVGTAIGSGAVKLHNVDDGVIAANSKDAVNGGQIFALSNGLDTLSDLAVTYDGPSRTSVTFGDASPTGHAVSLRNVAAGTLTASSTDAVNGAQLYATNQSIGDIGTSITNIDNRVTQNTTDISNVDARVTNVDNRVTQNSTDITNLDGRVTTNTTNIANNTTAITNIDNRVTQNSTDITALDARVTTNTSNITNLTTNVSNIDGRVTLLANGGAGPVQYSNGGTTPNGGTPTQDLTLVGANGGPVALHNVAPGVLAHGSTDAVNGGQVADAIQSSVSDLAVVYDDPSHTQVTLGGTGAPAVLLANVAPGELSATSTQAVNGAQLFATNQNVSTLSTSVTNISNQFSTLNGTVTQNTTDIANVTNNFNDFSTKVANGGVGPVQYSNGGTTPNGGIPSQDLTLVGAGSGPVALHNVAAGVLGIGSTDAVNGAQLGSLGTAVASTLGSFSYNPTTNSFTGSFSYGGNTYNDVQSVLGAIHADTTSGLSGDGKYFHANSTMADSSASGDNSTAVGPAATSAGASSVALGSNATATSDQSVAIGDNATANGGKAVSIGQGNTATGDGAVALGDPSVATGNGAVVAGKDDTATGTGAVAMGNTNTATGTGATAIGNINIANGTGAVALGTNNSASGLGSIAIGSNNAVTGDGSLALGSGIVTSATDTLAIGTGTSATAASAVALGNRAKASGLSSLAVGTDTSATGFQSATFGDSANASGPYSTAIGGSSQATTIASTAIGYQSSAQGIGGTALGAGATVTYANSVALGAAVETTRGEQDNYSAFGLSDPQNSIGEVAIAQNMAHVDPVTGISAPLGARQITGLAAGSAATDAVNVAQLQGVSSTIGTALASSLGGGSVYNVTTGAVSAPNYTLDGVTYTSVGDALDALARSTGVTSGIPVSNPVLASNIVTFDDASHAGVTLATGGTAVHNVSDGTVAAGSQDAVNGGQLAAVQTQVSTLATAVDNGSVGAVRYSDAATPTTPNAGTKTNDVTLVGANAAAPVGLHNVADGQVAAGSTDAVNGGQLAATNAHVATVETTANTALAMGQNSAQYDSTDHTSMTLGNGTDAVGLHNVADGTTTRDAVNLGQLSTATSAAVSESKAYTDGKIAALSFDLGKVRKDSAAGVAGALALAAMPQPYEAGKGMISGGVGAFMGQQAIAFGFAKAMPDEHTVVKIGATYNSRGQAAVNAGIGYQF